MDYILDQHNLATVQFLILLGVHGQRSPYGAGAWSQIRFATSVCIEMGLHRKKTVMDSPAHARDAEIRRRNFWACYCLDRVTSIVLGRAFAIADRDINVEVCCQTKPSGQISSLSYTSSNSTRSSHAFIKQYFALIEMSSMGHRNSGLNLTERWLPFGAIWTNGCEPIRRHRRRKTRSLGCTIRKAHILTHETFMVFSITKQCCSFSPSFFLHSTHQTCASSHVRAQRLVFVTHTSD